MNKVKAIIVLENSASSQASFIHGTPITIREYVRNQADKWSTEDGYVTVVNNDYMFKVEYEDYRGEGLTVNTVHFNVISPTGAK